MKSDGLSTCAPALNFIQAWSSCTIAHHRPCWQHTHHSLYVQAHARPAHSLPCKQVSEIKLRSLPFLRADTPVYDMLRLFETGRCHMALLTEPPDSRTGADSAPDASIARAGQMADLRQIRADPLVTPAELSYTSEVHPAASRGLGGWC